MISRSSKSSGVTAPLLLEKSKKKKKKKSSGVGCCPHASCARARAVRFLRCRRSSAVPHKLLPGTQTRRDLFPRRLPAMMTDGDRRLVSSPRRLRLRAWLAGRGCSVRPVVTSVRRFDKARNLTRCNKGHPVYSCRGLSGPCSALHPVVRGTGTLVCTCFSLSETTGHAAGT